MATIGEMQEQVWKERREREGLVKSLRELRERLEHELEKARRDREERDEARRDLEDAVAARDDLYHALLSALDYLAPDDIGVLLAMDAHELVSEAPRIVQRHDEASHEISQPPRYVGPRLGVWEVIRAQREGREPVPEWVDDEPREPDAAPRSTAPLIPFGANSITCAADVE
jgi:hypothetical protein